MVVWSVDELAWALGVLRDDPQFVFDLPPEPNPKARKGRAR